MHTSQSLILWSIVSFFIGAAVTVPALFWFLRTDPGSQLLRAYIVPPPTWPTVVTDTTQAPLPATLTSTTTPVVVAVPKTYATKSYSDAINSVVQNFNAVDDSYGRLVPLLLTINNKSLAHDYSNFFDLIVQAKALVSQTQSLTVTFSQSISSLSSANQQTSDATTKSQTFQLVSDGSALGSASQTFLTTVNDVLSGSVPSGQQIQTLNDQAKSLGDALTKFNTTAKSILSRFGVASTTHQ